MLRLILVAALLTGLTGLTGCGSGASTSTPHIEKKSGSSDKKMGTDKKPDHDKTPDTEKTPTPHTTKK
jgi:hypothetical protein